MIISCKKCDKKFELDDKLISSSGRLLQCGSCAYQWHYIPERKIELVNEVNDNVKKSYQVKKTLQKPIKKIIEKHKTIAKEGKIGFFSFLLITIILLVSLVILLDTFKLSLSSIIPNIDFYLDSLYDTLKDIFLFFKDLLK